MKIQYSHRVLIVFWFTWFWSMSHSFMIPVMLPIMQQSLALSIAATTLIMGSSSLGRSISAFSSGFLCKRFGSKNTIIFGVTLSSVSMLFASLSNYYLALLVLFFFIGVGGGTYLPAAVSILSDLYPSKTRGKYIGFHETAATAGITVGPIIAGLVLLFGLGWTGCLQIWLTPVIAILAAQLVLLKEPTGHISQPDRHTSDSVKYKLSGSGSLSRLLLLQIALVFRSAILSVAALFALYWTRQFGVDASTAALTLGATSFVAIFGQVAVGHFSDIFGHLRVLIIFNSLMSVMLTVCVCLSFDLPLIAFLLLFNLSSNAFFPVLFTFISEMTTPVERSKNIGLTMAVLYLFSSVHSVVLGFLADSFGFGIAWFYAIMLSFLSCLVLLALKVVLDRTSV